MSDGGEEEKDSIVDDSDLTRKRVLFICEGCNNAYTQKSGLNYHKRESKVCSPAALAAAERAAAAKEGDKFRVGDIFWGQCPGHPWWPYNALHMRNVQQGVQTCTEL